MVAPTTIITRPQASLSIALHCVRHATESVHGVLLGYASSANGGQQLIITDAVPVTHGTPTLPVVEVALGLLPHCMKNKNNGDNDKAATVQIIGWYTAPMLLKDPKPGPVALRMIANLAQATSSSSLVITDPILMVVKNEQLASFINGTETQTSASFLKAYTKDNGSQWLKPIDGTSAITLQDMDDVLVAIHKAKDQEIMISDLLDYYDERSAAAATGASSTMYWYPNDKVVSLL